MVRARKCAGAAFAYILWAVAAPGGILAADKAAGPAPSSNPMSGDAAAIQEGHQLYTTWCAQCHGAKADGVSERWGRYAADLRVFWRGYGEFVKITTEGRPEKQMPPWDGVIDETQISKIGAYLETLAMEGANWR